MEKRPVRIREILGIDAIGNDKQLDVVIEARIGMLLVTHHLIDGFAHVNAASLQFNLNQRQAIDENRYVKTVAIPSLDRRLVRDLKDILRRVVGAEKRKVDP